MTDFTKPQHSLPTWADERNGVLNVLIEITKGSINKYEYQKETGIIKLDRVLEQSTAYPVEYGLIPQTYDQDDDLLDTIMLITHPTFSGCLIEGRVVGICKFNDTGDQDDKILVVPNDDIRWEHIKDISDVPRAIIEEIEVFFTTYKNLRLKRKGDPTKKTTVEGWGNKEEALKIIAESQVRYKEIYKR